MRSQVERLRMPFACTIETRRHTGISIGSVSSDVLLQNKNVGELFVTYGALVRESGWWFRPVYTHMCFQVALSGESASTQLTAKGSLAGVNTIVHLKRTFATQDTMADRTFIRITKLVLDVLNKLLQFRRLRSVNLHIILNILARLDVLGWRKEASRHAPQIWLVKRRWWRWRRRRRRSRRVWRSYPVTARVEVGRHRSHW